MPLTSANAERPVPTRRELDRILRLEVPVIVRLAERRIALEEVLRLAGGAIIEFEKASDAPLDLLINNCVVGRGVAVKVGENFGVKLTSVGDPRELVKAMGGG